MQSKAIVFDCFGVLYADAYKQFLNNHASTSDSMQKYNDMIAAIDRGTMDRAELYSLWSQDFGLSVEDIRAEMDVRSTLDESMIELVRQLHGKYRLGMLSNVESGFLEDYVAYHGVRELFEILINSSEVGLLKPQPEIFHYAAEQFGLKPEEMIFIDDREPNVAGAAAVGMKGILYCDIMQLKRDLSEYVEW